MIGQKWDVGVAHPVNVSHAAVGGAYEDFPAPSLRFEAVVLAPLEITIFSDLPECVTACRDGSAYCSKVKGALIQLNHRVNSLGKGRSQTDLYHFGV